MAWRDIPPIEGVPDEMLRALNDRMRGLGDSGGAAGSSSSSRGKLFGPDQRPNLGTADADYRFFAEDFGREYRWTGRVWENAGAGDPQGRLEFFRADPGIGWHVCDGTTGIRSSKPDGTTELIAMPTGTGCYVKQGVYSASPVSASQTSAPVGGLLNTNVGAGLIAIAASLHTHNPGEPAHLVAGMYMRL